MFPNELARQRRAKVRLAIVFPAIGIAVLAVLFVVQDFPSPVLLWILFSFAFVFFEWHAVEVNDRLFASPSVMVLMTAAVAYGYESAILGAACMGALALLTPADISERRWFQPAVNFGQLVISATAAVAVLAIGKLHRCNENS